jgi:hypothetical protein
VRLERGRRQGSLAPKVTVTGWSIAAWNENQTKTHIPPEGDVESSNPVVIDGKQGRFAQLASKLTTFVWLTTLASDGT